MIRLDHFTIVVSDYVASRNWYTGCFGLHVAFEHAASGVGGLEDDADVELILVQRDLPQRERDCVLTFQCDSVHDTYRDLVARGVPFTHGPAHVFWGYGAELLDPDGYVIRLWDKATMPGYVEKSTT
jgi:catechol 2,3-dioxygenase-like lactoylglutathione lyase family enzyme